MYEERLFGKVLTFANMISEIGSYALRSGSIKKSEITRTKFISKCSFLINFNIKSNAFKSNLD